MYRLLTSVFDAFARFIDGITSGVSGGLLRFAQGPGQGVLFVLVLAFTGLKIVVEEVLESIDRIIAWIEKAIIIVALLAMTGFSFMDYLRREASLESFEIEGGANMAMLLMVWVGFLGASLATRRGAHLSVDASDRLLSPGAAKIVKRFSALVAAGLCWVLMENAWILTAEGIEFGDTLEGLVVWPVIVAPVNFVIARLPDADGVSWGTAIIGGITAAVAMRFTRRMEPDDPREIEAIEELSWSDVRDETRRPLLLKRAGASGLAALAGIAGGLALMALLPLVWEPTLEFGDPVVWTPIEAGSGFPIWLGNVVLPLAFALMALRFGIAGILGRFATKEGPPEAAITEPRKPGNRTRADTLVSGWFPGLLLGIGATLWLGKPALIAIAGILLVLVGAPLFAGIGVAALACVILLSDGLTGVTVVTDMFEATKKQELLAIPFFVLAGNIMTQGSLAERLVGVARAAMGKTPGGLGLATIFACVIFAAISGSSPVTVIAIGGLMFPMLIKDRYPEGYSIGVLASAGSLGIIIPPSIPMILYAVVTSNPQSPMSPIDLFLAGLLPGLFIAGVLVVYTLYKTRPSGGGAYIKMADIGEGYFSNIFQSLKRGFLALMLPVLILGGIYGVFAPIGIRFTVTEAAAVSVVYAIFVELFIHREMGLRKLAKILVESGVMMGSLFVIIVLAIAFNKFLAFEKIPDQATEWLAAHVDSKWEFLLLVNLFLLALGTVMEIISAILIVAPLLAPIAASFGIDPIHFGIIFIVNLELGYLTPPMGINLFVASTVFKQSIVKVIKASLPFLLLMLFSLAVVALVPALSTALPCAVNNDFEGPPTKACIWPEEVEVPTVEPSAEPKPEAEPADFDAPEPTDFGDSEPTDFGTAPADQDTPAQAAPAPDENPAAPSMPEPSL
ncbi:MAG: C4-dicarboxylate transporter DctM subunit [Cognaticolwellia sp.]